jgi:hypothetical protein
MNGNKVKKVSQEIKSFLFIVLLTVIGFVMKWTIGLSAMFMFYGIASGLLMFGITLASMVTALSGLSVARNDTFWRLLLLILCATFITLSVTI